MKITKLYSIAFLLLTVAITTQCAECDVPKDTPACIETTLRQFQQDQAYDTGARVTQYIFQGRTVYVFDPGLCGADMAAEVVDRECNGICLLGGIAGIVVCNGDTLYNTVTHERVIWSN